MKKLRLVILTLVMTVILCIGLASCNEQTVEQLTNELGAFLEGTKFKEGSILNLDQIEITDEKATEILEKLEDGGIAIDDKTKTYIYDIFVTKDNTEVQPDGKVKVILPAPDDERAEGYNVYHMKDGGGIESIPSTLEDGKVIFETDSFSSFVLVPTYNYYSAHQKTSKVYIGSNYNENAEVSYNGNKIENIGPDRVVQLEFERGSTVRLEALCYSERVLFDGWYEAEDFDLGQFERPALKDEPVSREMLYDLRVTEEEYAIYAVFIDLDEIVHLSYYPADGGTVTADSEPIEAPFITRWPSDNVYSLTATPNEGYVFDYWAVVGRYDHDTVSEASFDLTRDSGWTTVEAIFKPVITDISVEMSESIVFDPNVDGVLPDFANAKVYAVSVAGMSKLQSGEYTVDLGGLDAAKPGSYTVTYAYSANTDIKTTVKVTVLAESVAVRVENDGRGGSATPLGESILEKGSVLQLEAVTVSEDFVFLGWFLEDGTVLSSQLSYSFTANEDTLIIARFKAKNSAEVVVKSVFEYGYTQEGEVTVTANGRPLYAPNNEYFIGQLLRLNITSYAPHMVFYGWYEIDRSYEGENIDGTLPVLNKTPVSTRRMLEFEITSERVELYAVFGISSTTFSIDADRPEGAIIKDEDGKEIQLTHHENLVIGKTYTLTAEAREGYEFLRWNICERWDSRIVESAQISYTANIYTDMLIAEYRPLVTAITVDMEDVVYDASILDKYQQIGISEFNSICLEGAESEKWNTEYVVVGRITRITNSTWGNMYIEDGQGNEMHIYGLWTEDHTRYANMAQKPEVGDIIAVHGYPFMYKGEPEMEKAYLLYATPVLPDFEDVAVYAVTVDGSTRLTADQFTVDSSAVNTDRGGEYTVTYIYKNDPEIKATVTVQVVAEPTLISVWASGGTLVIDGVDIGPDYYEEFEDGYGKITITAKGEENTRFKGWYSGNDEEEILLSADPTYTFTVDGIINAYAEFEYLASDIYLDGLNMGFYTDLGLTEIYLNSDGRKYDLSSILVFAIINGEPELLAPEEYTVDTGGFNGDSPTLGDYLVTFTYKADPELQATHMIRVLDGENAVTLGLSSDPGGRVSADKPYHQYNKGEKITLSVELRSETDYEFLGWYSVVYGTTEETSSSTLLSADRSFTLTLNESLDVVARIEPKITYLAVEGFEESPVRIPLAKFNAYKELFAADRGGVFACGALGKCVELEAGEYTVDLGGLDPNAPKVGTYSLKYTYKADTSISFTAVVMVWDQDHSFLARVDSPDNGSLIFEGEITAEAGGQFIDGEQITVAAFAKQGYTFMGWYGVKEGAEAVEYEFITADPTYTFTIKVDTELQAQFGAPVTEISLSGAGRDNGGNYMIEVYTGDAVDISSIGVWSHSLLGAEQLTADDYVIDLGGLDTDAASYGNYTLRYTYKEDGVATDISTVLTVRVMKRSYLLYVCSDNGYLEYNGMRLTTLSESFTEGDSVTLTAAYDMTELEFAGWYMLNDPGEWELYSTDKTVDVLMTDNIELRAKFNPAVTSLHFYLNDRMIYQWGVDHWYFEEHGNWNDELQAYFCRGDIVIYDGSIYLDDITAMFESFTIIAVSRDGCHIPIEASDLVIEMERHTADEGWYTFTVAYGSFIMEITVIVMPSYAA